jgi:hypothetical protein
VSELVLPVVPNAGGESLSCVVCGFPREDGPNGSYARGRRPEYLTTIRTPSETRMAGVHGACLERAGLPGLFLSAGEARVVAEAVQNLLVYRAGPEDRKTLDLFVALVEGRS